MPMLDLTPLPALKDNYIWLAVGTDPGSCVVVDPGVGAPVEAALAARGLALEAVLVTHHHGDHTGGATALAAHHGVPVYGPAREAADCVTHPLSEGEHLDLPRLGVQFTVLEIPGHTLGHLAFVGGGALFCGDTLFSAGCGRLFEGTPAQMHASLARLAALPEDTRVCCGHEYTADNLRFAATVLPDDPAVAAHAATVAARRARGEPSLPSTIGLERAINPFLRLEVPAGAGGRPDWPAGALPGTVATFAGLRRWKDGFR
jgi:hydroxyacylglutathione hydrolase